MPSENAVLQGKAAIVTGGSRGIGRGIAKKMAEGGANVIVADIEDSLAQKTAEKLSAKFTKSLSIRVDVTDSKDVDKMVKLAMKEFGRVDILINNAGIMFRTRFLDLSLDEWNKLLDVNLTGPFLTSRAVIPLMKENGFGRIVNISSSAGKSVSTLGGAHYTASKAGLLGLTRAIAKEVASYGITVNSICPGLIDTPMVKDTTTSEELKNFIDSFPIKRLGQPEEVGDLVVFLCSEQASYITGASIDISGGDLMI